MSIPVPFALVARILSLVFAGLFVILAFFPTAYAPTYGIMADDGVIFMTQRSAPTFIFPMIALWFAAMSTRTLLRDAIAWGCALSCLGIAVSGVFAWTGGVATGVILIAAVLECVMAAALLLTYKN